MEELNLDLDNIEANAQEKLQVKDRYAKLTERGLEAEKKAQEAEAKAQSEANRAAKAEKDLEFYKSFSQVSSKHPGASDYQDQIKERVDRGMDAEEAAVAVLYKEGKLTQSAPVQQTRVDVAGGSALTNLGEGGSKSVNEMTSSEKMEALMQAEKEGANLLRF